MPDDRPLKSDSADDSGSASGPFPPSPPEPDDPRLAIPEELRQSFRPATSGAGAGDKSATATVAEMGKAWGTAMEFIFTIIGCGLLGYLYDRWQGGESKVGVLIGLATGFAFALYKIIRATQKEEALEKARKGKK